MILFKINRAKVSLPIIAHIPHSSTRLDNLSRKFILLSKSDLKNEIRLMTDWYTDEIFACVATFVGVTFVNNLSRLVYDPERFEDPRLETMEKVGMGLVYTRTHDGRTLRKIVSASDRRKIVRDYYRPYHQAFATAVAEIKKEFGRCLIVDGHSFSSTPLPYEPKQSRRRPDICIGTDAFHTSSSLTEAAKKYFMNRGVNVDINNPYAGTFVPKAYYQKDPSVQSIMVEINRSLYMDEIKGAKNARFGNVVILIEGLVSHLLNVTLKKSSGDILANQLRRRNSLC